MTTTTCSLSTNNLSLHQPIVSCQPITVLTKITCFLPTNLNLLYNQLFLIIQLQFWPQSFVLYQSIIEVLTTSNCFLSINLSIQHNYMFYQSITVLTTTTCLLSTNYRLEHYKLFLIIQLKSWPQPLVSYQPILSMRNVSIVNNLKDMLEYIQLLEIICYNLNQLTSLPFTLVLLQNSTNKYKLIDTICQCHILLLQCFAVLNFRYQYSRLIYNFTYCVLFPVLAFNWWISLVVDA